jgi:hypothetical protein
LTSWLFSFAGKISRAACGNKKTLAPACSAYARHTAIKPVRFAATTRRRGSRHIFHASSRDISKSDSRAAFRIAGLKPGKLDAIPLRDYVFCAEQV